MSGELKTAADQAKEKAVADLAYWRDRMTWTDAKFLAEYAHDERQKAVGQVKMIEEGMKAEADIEAYVHKYGTDEG